MMDASKGKTKSLFLTCDLLGGFSTGSFSFLLLFFDMRSFVVSSLLSGFTTSVGATSLSELASFALVVKKKKINMDKATSSSDYKNVSSAESAEAS